MKFTEVIELLVDPNVAVFCGAISGFCWGIGSIRTLVNRPLAASARGTLLGAMASFAAGLIGEAFPLAIAPMSLALLASGGLTLYGNKEKTDF